MELAGVVVGVGEGTHRYAEGDRVFAIVGGGAQAELCRVPEGSRPARAGGSLLGGGRRVSRGLLHRPRRAVHPGRPAGRRAGARLGGGRRGGDGGRPAGPCRRGSRGRLGPQPRPSPGGGRPGAAEVVVPDEVANAGPYDVSLELVGAPGVAATVPGAGHRGPDRGHRGAAPAPSSSSTCSRSWGRGPRCGGSTLRSRSSAEKAAVARAVEDQVLPLLAAGTVRVPVADRFPLSEATGRLRAVCVGGQAREDRARQRG